MDENYLLSYRQLLHKYRNLPVYKLIVADDVDSILIASEAVELNDDEFELVCMYVYDYIMNSDISADELVNYIHDAHMEGLPIIEYILNDKWKKADEIIYNRM